MTESVKNLFLLAPHIMFGSAIVIASYFAALIVRSSLSKTFRRFSWEKPLGSMITTLIFYTILVIGVVAGIGTMGVNITPVIASLGLGGFAIGLALRDAISNLLSGALILIYRPFATGDNLTVTGLAGEVVEINMRYTVLKGDGEDIMIPNSLIFNNPIKVRKKGEAPPA